MHDLFGSPHMLWGLQLLLGVTWSVVLQNSLAPQPLRSMTQHLTDDTHQRNLTWFFQQSRCQNLHSCTHADHTLQQLTE